ncbi:MAG: acyltransferase [Ruminococcaceae bacterium]|nr:acyltransferase [Oscillospiraceae bacterium]
MKKYEISLLNVILCLLVIFIHISSEPVTKLVSGTVTQTVIFSAWKASAFVVQGFIMLSGAKLYLSEKKEKYLPYILARFTKIYIPYIIAVTVYYMFFFDHKYYPFSLKDLGMYILRGDLSAQFYFVVVIMQYYLLKKLWDVMVAKVPAVLGILVSLVISILGIFFLGNVFGMYNDRVFTTYLVYWVIGCYIGKNYDRFKEIISKSKIWIFALYAITAVAEIWLGYLRILPYYISELIHMLYCMCAIFTCYNIAIKLGEKAMKLPPVKAIDSASYYIYLWHVLVLTATDMKMTEYAISDIGTRFAIRTLSTYLITILLCAWYVRTKKK